MAQAHGVEEIGNVLVQSALGRAGAPRGLEAGHGWRVDDAGQAVEGGPEFPLGVGKRRQFAQESLDHVARQRSGPAGGRARGGLHQQVEQGEFGQAPAAAAGRDGVGKPGMQIGRDHACEQVEEVARILLAHALVGGHPEREQGMDPVRQFQRRGHPAHDGAGPAAHQRVGEIAAGGQQEQVVRPGAEALGPAARIRGCEQVGQPARLFAQAGVCAGADAVARHGLVDRFRQGDFEIGPAEQRAPELEQRCGARRHALPQRRTGQLDQQGLCGQAHFLAPVVQRTLQEGFVFRPDAHGQASQQPGARVRRFAGPGLDQCIPRRAGIAGAPVAQDRDALLDAAGLPVLHPLVLFGGRRRPRPVGFEARQPLSALAQHRTDVGAQFGMACAECEHVGKEADGKPAAVSCQCTQPFAQQSGLGAALQQARQQGLGVRRTAAQALGRGGRGQRAGDIGRTPAGAAPQRPRGERQPEAGFGLAVRRVGSSGAGDEGFQLGR